MTPLAAAIGDKQRRILVVLERTDELTWKSLRNVGGMHLLVEDQLNTYDVLCADEVVFTEGALQTYVNRATGGSSTETTADQDVSTKAAEDAS